MIERRCKNLVSFLRGGIKSEKGEIFERRRNAMDRLTDENGRLKADERKRILDLIDNAEVNIN